MGSSRQCKAVLPHQYLLQLQIIFAYMIGPHANSMEKLASSILFACSISLPVKRRSPQATSRCGLNSVRSKAEGRAALQTAKCLVKQTTVCHHSESQQGKCDCHVLFFLETGNRRQRSSQLRSGSIPAYRPRCDSHGVLSRNRDRPTVLRTTAGPGCRSSGPRRTISNFVRSKNPTR